LLRWSRLWVPGFGVGRRPVTWRSTASGCAAVPPHTHLGHTHLLAAFSAGLQGVIGQLRVAPEANEITAALELLKTLPLQGVTVTGDAIFTQKTICQVIIDGGGDYFFTVKGNQPALKSDIEQAFRPLSPLGGMVAAA
jgi:hypothetical protein